MDGLSRRRFLIASGVTGGAALAVASGTVTWSQLHQRAVAAPAPVGSKILVIVTLYGGNDGLNTLIPYTDPAYHSARPDLAYSEADVLKLDTTAGESPLGLNPSMTGFQKLWQSKRLAIVRGVGYPKPDHSHFRSMDIWQTASPDQPVNTGWIGRWLDATGDDPVRAVNIGSVLPPLAVGARCTAAALPMGKSTPLDADLATGIAGLGVAAAGDTGAQAMVRAGYRAERTVTSTFASILDPNASDPDADQQAAASSAGGQGSLKEQLAVVGRCVKAGVPTTVYAVSLGGFDTHASEKASQQAQLGSLDGAVADFLTDMAGNAHGQGVVVLVYSEFGRRVAANASQGTDHGTAGPVFVAGVPVKGGFYGSQPSLTDLDAGDLKSSTDFRVVYGELTAKVLGTDPGKVLGSQRPELGFIA
jgi:uncharacterized protein (DUF1501 family)